ncbi:hypothetical protein ACO0LF_28175 [Undibacterium sp. Di27W]|uniref:hypothetical protein n=1 Tax=Undibacterium sp. Di27W TaxID=3413036 RepID=UPI003BF43305
MGLELVYVGFFFLFLWAVAYLASGLGFVYAYKRRRTNLRKAFIVGFLSFCVFVPTSIFLIKRIWPAHINVTVDESTTIDTIMSQEKAHCFKSTGLDNDYYCDGIIYYLTVHLPDKTVFRVKAKSISMSTYPGTRKLRSISADVKQSYSKEELTAYLKRKEEQKQGDFNESIIPQKISDEIMAWLAPSEQFGSRHTGCFNRPEYRLCLVASGGSSGDYTLQFWVSKD